MDRRRNMIIGIVAGIVIGGALSPLGRRRHGRIGRSLGTPALRLVRSQPRRPHDDRLQLVGRRFSYVYTFQRQPDGSTNIHVVIVREGKNLKGRVLGTIGRGVLKTAFENSVKAIEARNGARDKLAREY